MSRLRSCFGFRNLQTSQRQRKQLERFDLEILVSGFKALADRPFAIRSLDETEIHLTVERLERFKENFSNFVGPIPWYTEVDFPGSIEMATNFELRYSPLPLDHLGQLIERSKVSCFDLSTLKIHLIVNKNEPNKVIRLLFRNSKDSRKERFFETVQESIAFTKRIQEEVLETTARQRVAAYK